jgi:hypothetical protein
MLISSEFVAFFFAVHETSVLEWILEKRDVVYGLDSSGSG